MQMKTLMPGVALAALMITAPAMAGPDWQAVAKFDEMIAKHHGFVVVI